MNKPDLNIITSESAERMRQAVTAGFYDRSELALWLFEVMGREYDEMGDWAKDLRKEAFIPTCTWSITIWEELYGIPSDDTLPLQFRRERLMAKELSRPPANPARIEAMLSALTGEDVIINENVAPYTFGVVVGETEKTIYDYRLALRMLRQVKPSHLSFTYQSRVVIIYTSGDYYFGASSDRIIENYTGDDKWMVIEKTDYAAGATTDYVKELMIEETVQTHGTTDIFSGVITDFIKEDYTDNG